MAEQSQGAQQPPLTQLELVKKQVYAAPSAVALIETPEEKETFVATYNAYMGGKEGALRWEQEKHLIIQAVIDNPKLEQCDRFSFHIAIWRLAQSGLTLNEQMASLVPYGKKVVMIPGYKGRMQQMNDMPDIIEVLEPQVVYDCDKFKRTLGENPRVTLHEPLEERPDGAKIILAYLVIITDKGPRTTFVDRDKVYKARAKSASYQYWMSLLALGFTPGADGKIIYDNKQGSTWPVEPPFWITNEEDGWKKTVVKRAYDRRPNKLKRHKEIDNYLKDAKVTEEMETNNTGKEEFTEYEEMKEETDRGHNGEAAPVQGDPNYKGF